MSVEHDVLIAGASFAGLAAARVLGPAALLLDRAPLGAGQTSACAAPTALVERMGAGPATVQRHEDARVRTTTGEIDVRMVVDATGPRSTLAGAGRGRRVAFGLETEIATPPAGGP